MPGKRYFVRLSEDGRSTLTKLVKAEKGVPPKKRMRAQILLKVDQGEQGPGWTDEQVAKALDVHVNTVHAVRRELVMDGFEEALNRYPDRATSGSPGAKHTIGPVCNRGRGCRHQHNQQLTNRFTGERKDARFSYSSEIH